MPVKLDIPCVPELLSCLVPVHAVAIPGTPCVPLVPKSAIIELSPHDTCLCVKHTVKCITFGGIQANKACGSGTHAGKLATTAFIDLKPYQAITVIWFLSRKHWCVAPRSLSHFSRHLLLAVKGVGLILRLVGTQKCSKAAFLKVVFLHEQS